MISMPASILGNEAALKFGRHRAITVVMIASACVALIIGLSATAPAWVLALLLLAYGLTVPADSRCVDCRHVCRCDFRTSRRDPGLAFDGRLRSVGGRSLGNRRRARRRRRPTERDRPGCWRSSFLRPALRSVRSRCSGRGWIERITAEPALLVPPYLHG